MKNIIIYISLFLIAQVSFGQCPLNKIVNEINTNSKFKTKFKENPDFVTDYIANGRKNKIDLDIEEALGGHSKARHGSHLTDADMEQRVLGNHPDFSQSRSALKFDSDVIHQDAVNKAFQQHKSTIESHFKSSDDYLTLEYDYGSKVGSGFTNTGTRNNPISSPVESNKIIIALKRDATNTDGYILDSAYPFFN